MGMPAMVKHVIPLPCVSMFGLELPSRQREAQNQPTSESLTFRNFFTLQAKLL